MLSVSMLSVFMLSVVVPSLVLVGKGWLAPNGVGQHNVVHCHLGKARPLLANLRLGWKGLQGTNASSIGPLVSRLL
jgi:hypothetical protein